MKRFFWAMYIKARKANGYVHVQNGSKELRKSASELNKVHQRNQKNTVRVKRLNEEAEKWKI